MLIYHTIYAYMYKKEMKQYENDLEIRWVYQSFNKIYFGLHKVKIDI